MEIKRLSLPLSHSQIKSLKAGEIVLLSGTIYTARDAAHKKMTDAIDNNLPLPFDLNHAAIYYCGAAPSQNGNVIGSCGPTTSLRMDDYTPALLDRGLSVMIGKGKRSNAVIESMKKNTAVYLVAVGGAGALTASYIKSATPIAYEELGCEQILELKVEDFELVVGIDCYGRSVFDK